MNATEAATESVESEEQLFQLSLNKNGESFKLWSTYVDWIEQKWKDDALSEEAVDELMTVSSSTLLLLSGDHFPNNMITECLPESNNPVTIIGRINS